LVVMDTAPPFWGAVGIFPPPVSTGGPAVISGPSNDVFPVPANCVKERATKVLIAWAGFD